ncbi:PEP-CTERM sorting domain-containing protein [Spartinivicinus ruber]|uniref:PEP-CTERM sorting domain-containing protein n=1 Tax=Spartinivicinus ruber TaxID=2683272 RepID=UPI0013D76EEF|nr:PEP-CTERM sorting domain-containing protein [Spartinivicinus ruber]
MDVKNKLLGFLAGTVLCGVAATANATLSATMTFEGVAPAGSTTYAVTPYTENGFTLTNSLGAMSGSDGIFSATSGDNTNGTDIFGWCSGCGPLVISLTKDGGGLFDFLSFDSAVLETGIGPNFIDVVGLFPSQPTMTVSITQTETWTTENINFIGVSQVNFIFGTGHLVFPNHAMDNLVLHVPEPASLALMGLGLLGMGYRRKGLN